MSTVQAPWGKGRVTVRLWGVGGSLCSLTPHLCTGLINAGDERATLSTKPHFIPLKAWARFRRNTEGKGRVVMTGPFGTHPLLLLAISGQSVGMTTRLADPATSCRHPCVHIARHSLHPPLASMGRGLFSCVLLRSASLMRWQAAGGMSP